MTKEDQIKEVMGLCDEFALKTDAYQNGEASKEDMLSARRAIKSKLRELLNRAPLTDDQITRIDDSTHFHECMDWNIRFARAIERAHGICQAQEA